MMRKAEDWKRLSVTLKITEKKQYPDTLSFKVKGKKTIIQ